jgi:hypothetical protein
MRIVKKSSVKPSAWGYNRAMLFLGDINTGTWPSSLRVPKLREYNMVMSPEGLVPENDYAGEGQQQL